MENKNAKNIEILREELIAHNQSNQVYFIATNEKLAKLMVLVNLVPFLQEIAEEHQTQTYISKKIARWIGIFASIMAIIAGILAAIWYTIRIKKGI